MTFLVFLIGLGLGCYLGFRLGVVASLGMEFRILFFNKDVLAWRQLYDVNSASPNDRLLLAYDVEYDDAAELLKTQLQLANLRDDEE